MGLSHSIEVARLLDLVEEELAKPAQPVAEFPLPYLGVAPRVAIGLYDGCYSRLPEYGCFVSLLVRFAPETVSLAFGCALSFILFRIAVDNDARLTFAGGVPAFLVGAPSLAFLGHFLHF